MIKRKIKRVKRKKEENVEIIRIQLKVRENEISELRKELDEIHESISYRIASKITKTSVGRIIKNALKSKSLKKYM